MADFPKKQQQCLIPKYLLEYATDLQENHPDPSASWGGGSGGSPIEAGTGIEITGDETKTISVDDETVAMVANLAPVAFSGSYNDLSNKPTIPTKTSELTNDSGYLVAVAWNDIYNKPTFATVATSGNYNDLTNKPDIPTKTSDLTNDSGFITSSDIPTNYVTTNTEQTITGIKTFSAGGNYPITVQGDYGIHLAHNNNHAFLSPMEFKINGGFGSHDALAVHTSDITNYDYSHNSSSQLYFPSITTENANVIYALPGKTGTLALTSDIITSYNDLTDKPTIPTATSQLTNDSGYITNSALIGYATERWVLNKGYITGITSSDVTTALGYTPGTSNFSGSYNDLTNKPTIPTATSDLNNDSGFITSSALSGYATETWVGNQGYITGITSSDVITALGYTPGTSNFTGLEVIALAYNEYTISASDYAKLGVNTIITRSEQNTSDVWTYVYLGDNDTYIKYGRTIPQYSPGSSNGEFKFQYLLIKKTASPNKTHAISFGYNIYHVQVPTATSDLTNDSGFITGITSSDVTTALGYTPGTSNFSGDYDDLTDKPDLSIYETKAEAFSGNYNDLTNKPTIPTVNDNTITITQGGVTKGSFTLNQNTNQTINIDDAPGMIGEVLYDVPNGEAGVNPITMAHSFADYSYVDIQYRNYDNAYEVKSVRVYDPNGKHVYLDWDVLVNGAVYAKKSIYILNGTTMTVRDGSDMQAYYSNSSTMGTQPTATTDYQHQIKITKVIGYKANSSAMTTEQWTFTLQDDTTVTKNIVVF